MKAFLVIALMCMNFLSFAQDEEAVPSSTVDTTFVQDLSRRWSLRVYSVAKFQTTALKNLDNKETVKYYPRNPFGIGIGFAYRYLIIDLGINLRVDKSNPESQFDFQGTLLAKGEAFDFFIQRYNGFRGRKFEVEEEKFRNDINTLAVGLNYLHSFNHEQLSLASVFQGGSIQKKSAGSWVVGGYWSYHQLEADSSIVPSSERELFNSYAQIEQTRITNVGITGGYAYDQVLPGNFFLFVGAFPGIGLNFGSIKGEEDYSPEIFPAGKLTLRAAVGRATEKHYTILSFSMDRFLVDIGNQNRFRYNMGKIKLVVGFRMKSKLKKVDEVLPDF